MNTPTLRRFAGRLIVAAFLVGISGCKPSAHPAAGQDQPPPAADAQHRPQTDDLARFLRGKLPPQLKLVDLRNDPPVPLPGAVPGSNAWLYSVRVTVAPTEDVLGPPLPKEAKAFRTAVDELNTLAAWSQAYARSPYNSRYPGFAVEPPSPARPRLLVLLHARDQPLAPLYGKVSAEWQVDHWQYAGVSMQVPTDVSGKLRSAYHDPILIQGSPEAARFLAQVQASLAAARPRKAALDAAYHADLLAATQPGMVYKGQLTHGKHVLPAEARFVAAPANEADGDPDAVRMEFRLTNPSYVYRLSVRLATSPPVQVPASVSAADDQDPPADEDEDDGGSRPAPVFKGDLALGYLGVTDPRFDPSGTASYEFRSATMAEGGDGNLWLSIQNHHLAGKMTLYAFTPPYLFDGQEAP